MKSKTNKTTRKLLASFLLVGGLFPATVLAQYPDLAVDGPTTNFPDSFSDFTPPVDQNLIPHEEAPEIYEYTRDNNAGDTMIVTGEKFSQFTDAVNERNTTVHSLSFNDEFVATIKLNSKWTADTIIEVTCKAFDTPDKGGRIFYAASEANQASIYYNNGTWYAKDGAAGTIDMGDFDMDLHTFRYDSVAQTASIDNQSYPLKGAFSSTGPMYLACNSPGYQAYPMNLVSCKVWQGGQLVEDLVPTVEGTIMNRVTGLEYYSLKTSAGQSIPLTIQATRTISFSGENGQDTTFVACGNSKLIDCEIIRLDGAEAAVTLSKTLPPDEMYLVWPGNAKGFGRPVAVNQTEAWWIGPNEVHANRDFSVYGRNLGTDCHIYIEELGQWFEPKSCNPYKADFTMPDVGNGTYTIWAHNGSGREYGWSSPLTVTVTTEFKWGGKQVVVQGPKRADFYTALNASSSGDTLYLPAGTYSWESFAYGFSDRVIVGDGMDSTIITVDSTNTGNPGNARLFDGIYNNVLFSNLTIKAHDTMVRNPVKMRGKNLRFDSVKLSALGWPGEYTGATPFVFDSAGPNLIFNNCKFVLATYPGSMAIGATKQVFFTGCDFIGASHNSQLLVAWGAQEVSITDCRAYPYNSGVEGHFDGRWFVTAAYWGTVNHIYFGQNTSSNIAPPKIDGYHSNTGEQILIEGGDFRTRGVVRNATLNTIQVGDVAEVSNNKHTITIVGGRGYGQTRKISSIDTNTGTFHLEDPWRVAPDNTSTAVVSAATYRFVVYDNHLDGKAEWVQGTKHTASTGVESYGGSVDLVVDSNLMTDLRSAIVHWPLGGRPHNGVVSLQSCFFNTFKNNRIENCWQGVANMASSDGGILDGGILAATYRDNYFDGITTMGVSYTASTNKPVHKTSLYERNVFNNCEDYAIKDTDHVQNQLYLFNSGTNQNTGVAMSISHTHVPALLGNEWSGYAEEFKVGPSTELPPDTLLEVPIRVVKTSSSSLTFTIPIRNSGVARLDWNASTQHPWINLTKSQGIIQNQQTEDELILSISPDASGSFTGTVVVASNNEAQSRLITIIYSGEEMLSGNELVYSLAHYTGRPIQVRLHDELDRDHAIGPISAEYEVVLKNLNPDLWYFLVIEELVNGELQFIEEVRIGAGKRD